MAVPAENEDGASLEQACTTCGRIVVADPHAPVPTCPSCGGALAERVDEDDPDAPPKAPWHFKLLLVGTAGYLVYRLIWFIFWIFGHAWRG